VAYIRKTKKKDIEVVINKAPSALQKFSKSAIGKMSGVFDDAETLYCMLRDWYMGRYEMPWKTVAAIAAALIYLINPLDLIPDFIPVVGYIDDAFVFGLCIKLIRKDLDRYRSLNSKSGPKKRDAFCAYCDEDLLVDGNGIYECPECHLDFEVNNGKPYFHKNKVYCPKCDWGWKFERIDKEAEYYCPNCDTLLWSYQKTYYS